LFLFAMAPSVAVENLNPKVRRFLPLSACSCSVLYLGVGGPILSDFSEGRLDFDSVGGGPVDWVLASF
jgi:hypothetical protein